MATISMDVKIAAITGLIFALATLVVRKWSRKIEIVRERE